MVKEAVTVALCKARHDIIDGDFEVTDAIFENTIENPSDMDSLQEIAKVWIDTVWDENNRIYIYVTGLSQALTSVLTEVKNRLITYRTLYPLIPGHLCPEVILMHWDRNHELYIPQIFI